MTRNVPCRSHMVFTLSATFSLCICTATISITALNISNRCCKRKSNFPLLNHLNRLDPLDSALLNYQSYHSCETRNHKLAPSLPKRHFQCFTAAIDAIEFPPPQLKYIGHLFIKKSPISRFESLSFTLQHICHLTPRVSAICSLATTSAPRPMFWRQAIFIFGYSSSQLRDSSNNRKTYQTARKMNS